MVVMVCVTSKNLILQVVILVVVILNMQEQVENGKVDAIVQDATKAIIAHVVDNASSFG